MKPFIAGLLLWLICVPALGQGVWSNDSSNGQNAVGGGTACIFDNKIYLIGGSYSPIFGNGEIRNFVQIFDPINHIWSMGPSLPVASSYLACDTLNGKIYAFGGTLGTGSMTSNIVQIFDGNSWSMGPSMPHDRFGFSSFTIDSKIYLFGGYDSSSMVLNAVDVFDPSNNSWSSTADIPSPHAYFASAIAGKKVYLFGGYVGSKACDSVEIFNSDSNSWSYGVPMPIPIAEGSACFLNGKIYVTGGINNTNVWSTLEIFDTSTNAWTLGPSMSTSRVDLVSIAYNDKIYAIDGLGGSDAVGANEVFTPSTSSVAPVTVQQEELVVNPNPASSEIQILPGPSGDVHLLDVLGREALKAKDNGEGITLDISTLPPGTYFLSIGNRSKKIVVTR